MATKSKLSNEGYILFNHKDSPGIEPAIVKSIDADLPSVAGRSYFEAPTYTCSHCQFVVVLNPLRQRERGYCSKCDHYICDRCNTIRIQTNECKTWLQVVDEVAEAAIKDTLIKEL